MYFGVFIAPILVRGACNVILSWDHTHPAAMPFDSLMGLRSVEKYLGIYIANAMHHLRGLFRPVVDACVGPAWS